MVKAVIQRPVEALKEFMANEAAGGLVLMAAAALALLIANSPLAGGYHAVLEAHLGPLSVEHWINDGLMAVFFLLVGMEIKREALQGELADWPSRLLPGLGALGGMVVPALIYAALNAGGRAAHGWAIPTATDIAFALGVISLLGDRVPSGLKVFLAALAIIDDLGAVAIIAVFYSGDLQLYALLAAAGLVAVLVAMNLSGVRRLRWYLPLGVGLWLAMYASGVHATLSGVLLALTIPLRPSRRMIPIAEDAAQAESPLLRLEHALAGVVAFAIVPIFGLANAGVDLADIGPGMFLDPLTLGVAGGLLLGKPIGVTLAVALLVRFRLARLPAGSTWMQFVGVAMLCGIGFTMSLFVGLLAFAGDAILQEEVKLGILCGSLLAGLGGYAILRLSTPVAPAVELEVQRAMKRGETLAEMGEDARR